MLWQVLSMTDFDNAAAEPARGELFADPGLRAVWPAILKLSEPAKHQALEALREHLALAHLRSTPSETREARAVSALREAVALLRAEGSDDPLTLDHFRRLRDQHPANGWPPDSSIRRWMGGSWNDALRRAHLPAVPEGDTLKVNLGGALTAEEAVAALKMCAGELDGPISFSRYRHWASRPEVKARPGRRPLSQPPFDRLFGGWDEALVAAGILDGESGQLADGSLRPSGYRYKPEQLAEALQEAAAHLGRSPRTAEYQRLRSELRQQDTADGRPAKARPSYSVFLTVHGNWDAALAAADLEPLGGRATQSNPPKGRKVSRRARTDEELLDVLAQAYASLGDPFTTTAYDRWRTDQLREIPAGRRHRGLPIYATYLQRFGSWAQAVEAMHARRASGSGEERS